jgi:hypothetical protein
MQDKQTGIAFLNDNLRDNFESRGDSITGIPGSRDALDHVYETYAFELLNTICLTCGLEPALYQITSKVENLVYGLVEAKKAHKLEGSKIQSRDVQIHWRQYPAVEFNEFLSETSQKLAVTFRLSVHHK